MRRNGVLLSLHGQQSLNKKNYVGQGPDCWISHAQCPNPLVWLMRVSARKQLHKCNQCDSWTTQSDCSLQLPVSPCGLTPEPSTAGGQVSPAWPSPAHHMAQHPAAKNPTQSGYLLPIAWGWDVGKLSSFLQLPIHGATEAIMKGGMTVGPTAENCIFM